MLLAFERGAELIVAVGTHNSMVEFLDKGRPGMASTFLVRMKVGPILVDAKGVSRLYQNRVRKRDLFLLILAAIVTIVLIAIASEPVRVARARPRAAVRVAVINLRYHIVSITAVFLALGIGITLGSTFIGRETLDRIDQNVKSARAERDRVRAENADLRKQLGALQKHGESLDSQGIKRLFADDLKDVPTLVIAAPGRRRRQPGPTHRGAVGLRVDVPGHGHRGRQGGAPGGAADDMANALGATTRDPATLAKPRDRPAGASADAGVETGNERPRAARPRCPGPRAACSARWSTPAS